MPRLPLLDQVALVTGASSGIGRATALALAEQGAHVALASRSAERLEETAEAIRRLGRQALVVPTDVRRREDVSHLVRQTLETRGQIDILIANAGAYIRTPVPEMRVQHFEESLQVNFYGALYVIIEALPAMLERRRGHIVLMSSMDAQKGMPLDAPYVSAKYALRGLGEVMRQELRPYGIFVTTIFPGRVDTPLIDYLDVPRISAKIPPARVAKAVVRAVRRHQPEVIVPGYAKALVYLNTISPRLGDWLVRVFHFEGWDRRAASHQQQ